MSAYIPYRSLASIISACLRGGGEPQAAEVTRLGGVTRQAI